jgi:tRNA G10  N-methylase Trm11
VWSTKPHNYCAGLPLPLATLAVNLATALEPSTKTVVDPCCGSGTLLFAAACLGAGAVAGVERHPLLLQQAAENLGHTAAVALASRNHLAQEAGGSGSDAAQCDSLPPQLLCADSSQVVFDTLGGDGQRPAVRMRVFADTTEKLTMSGMPRRRIDAIVSNLPYGRMVGVAAAEAPAGDRGLEALAPLLSWLRLQATRHAFFSGTRLAPLLRSLGYAEVDEVCVDLRGRRFLALASCGEELRPSAET